VRAALSLQRPHEDTGLARTGERCTVRVERDDLPHCTQRTNARVSRSPSAVSACRRLATVTSKAAATICELLRPTHVRSDAVMVRRSR